MKKPIEWDSLAYPQSAANKNSCCNKKEQEGIKQSTNIIDQKSNVEMNHKVSVLVTNHKVGGIATVDNRVINMKAQIRKQRIRITGKLHPFGGWHS